MSTSLQGKQTVKILYVEDDPYSQELVRRVLQPQGYDVVLASDGLAGIRLAQVEQPHLILMDINMKHGLNGCEIATRLRGIPALQQTPIIAITGDVTDGNRESTLIAGCDGYITKPIDARNLPDQIRAYLSGHRDQVPEAKRQLYLQEYNRRLVERLESKVIELEKTNRDLQEANHALRKLDKTKSNFILLLTHELRTPLAVIKGYAELLLLDNPCPENVVVPPSYLQSIESVMMAVDDLTKIVDDLLNVSSIELGRIELNLGPTSISDVVHRALSQLSPLSQHRDLSIELLKLNSLPSIQADAQQLMQVFLKLIGNAIKYTPDGGQIRIWGRKKDDLLEIVVQDSGIGIDPEEQHYIFDHFYVLEEINHHSSSQTAFMGGGLGLGLYIARGIVETHGGRIWVESERYDETRCLGSQFHILLPIAVPTDKS